MIYKTLNTDAEGALNGTTALHMVALQKGAHILRVHDVAPALECIALHQALQTDLGHS
jgi:dihydropteroate synthase